MKQRPLIESRDIKRTEILLPTPEINKVSYLD